jgi:hypothetical protein
MAEQGTTNHVSTWTVREKAFGVATVVSAALATYFAMRGWRIGGFAVATVAFSISWWSARRARIKGDL